MGIGTIDAEQVELYPMGLSIHDGDVLEGLKQITNTKILSNLPNQDEQANEQIAKMREVIDVMSKIDDIEARRAYLLEQHPEILELFQGSQYD